MGHFKGANILSVDQFERGDIDELFATADRMEPFAQRRLRSRALEGAILNNLFFEPSTRTRISFGSAFNLLGGHVSETTDIKASSLVKGESLRDTARVLSGFGDVIVMRHPQEGSVAEFASASRVPVLNGGDGSNEHPSQALLDLYTIRKEMKARDKGMDGLKIAMVGDLKYGRTVHSLCKLLTLYQRVRVVLVSPRELAMPDALVERLSACGHEVVISDELGPSIANVDIVYSTRIQEERFVNRGEADLYRGRFRLNQAIYTQHCQPKTVIMHPLPRDSRAEANELDVDLDDNPNLAIFRQTDNGLLVRMAMFALVLDVVDVLDSTSEPVRWFRREA